MAGMDDLDFDPNQDYSSVVPAGDYVAAIVGSERKPTKSGNGDLLELQVEILEGEHQGRKVFDRLNLWNQNTDASNIAKRTLKEICKACNLPSIKDSSQLHDLPMLVSIVSEVRKDNGELSNRIKKYAANGQPRAAISVKNPFA